MLLGGALAGLAGMVHYAGIEYKLRPGLTTNFGYIAFLASWLARHNPLPIVLSAMLLAAIAVAGDSLQLDCRPARGDREHPDGSGAHGGTRLDGDQGDATGGTIVSSLAVDVMSGAVVGGTAIMYAGLGETVSERAGVINLGTEGCMLGGALAAYATTAVTGSPWVGVPRRHRRGSGARGRPRHTRDQ
jgi:ABC-type uncharacterized transport system permease subunit